MTKHVTSHTFRKYMKVLFAEIEEIKKRLSKLEVVEEASGKLE